MGLDRFECCWRTERSNWFGHQSWFFMGRWALGVGASITGFSLSLRSDTTVLLLARCSFWLVIAHALGAAAPEDDLGFVDLEARVVRRGQARRIAHRAVDVDHPAAASADEVVMIVADPVVVAGRGTGRLDPSEETLVGQRRESVVHRLARDRTELC